MHQPRPYGLFGEPQDSADAAVVDKLMRTITNIRRAGSIDSLRLVRALPSGGVVLAMDMGGVFKAILQYPSNKESIDGAAYGSSFVPMLFSGVVKRANFQYMGGIELQLTKVCARRIVGYKDNPVGQSQTLIRFAVPYATRHTEFKPRRPGEWVHSQYVALRPTWFSGRMASLVQIAGGYGRQDFRALPNNKIERARMVLPDKVVQKIEHQLPKGLLPGYRGWPPESGEIQFDYKFHETHGVAFDSKRKPWLVRVNPSGVYAMPLPMVPATTTKAFREYIQEVGDDEIEWVLDQFGGMPSGEGFPLGARAFESWRRAGAIIKVCDTSDFYTRNMGYSSAMGWSFNDSGTEAVNTGYDFSDADGFQIGRTYKLSLRLGPEKPVERGSALSDYEMEAVNRYMAKLMQVASSDQRGAPVKFKMARLPLSTIFMRARSSGEGTIWENELSYWDNYEGEPIASHSGSMVCTGEGNLWARGKPKTHPQIKFPEPLSDPPGCLSHDFGQLEGFPVVPSDQIVRCDTIMHAYYVGDDLKVVKYFLDTRSYTQDVEHNFDECMQVGSWQKVEHTGQSSIFGHFYTSDIDEREAFAPITTTTKIVGTDLGYDHTPHFSFDHFFSMVGTIWRNRYFKHETEIVTTEGKSRTIATCVPYLARNAIFHAKTTSTSGERKTKARSLHATGDPNTYRYFTYDFVMAWVGGNSEGNMASAGKVSPTPKDGVPVWVTGYNYYPSACSDFADQGNWLGGVPQDYTWLIHPNANEWKHNGGGGAPKITPSSSTITEDGKSEGDLKLSFMASTVKVNSKPRDGFFIVSPNEYKDVFYADAVKIVAGTAEYANCSESDADAPNQRKRWGFTRLADHKSAHHFIGVINE